MLAFCARYGHQPLSELRSLTSKDLERFYKHVSELIRREPAFGVR